MTDPITFHKEVKMNFTLCGQRCHLILTLNDSVSLLTGDGVEHTSIDVIIGEDGQTIHPKTVTVEEFRAIVRNVRYNHALL